MIRHALPILEGSRRVLCLLDAQPNARHSPDNAEHYEIHVNLRLVRVEPKEDRSSASKKLTDTVLSHCAKLPTSGGMT